MSRVVDITEYRQQRKRLFLEKNKVFIDEYIRDFIYAQCQLSYDVLQHHYINSRQLENEMAWDYLDFRDTLSEAVSEVLGSALWDDIRRQSWFRKGMLSRDEVMDRMVSLFILGPAVSGME